MTTTMITTTMTTITTLVRSWVPKKLITEKAERPTLAMTLTTLTTMTLTDNHSAVRHNLMKLILRNAFDSEKKKLSKMTMTRKAMTMTKKKKTTK